MAVLEVLDVHVAYGPHRALDGVSLSVGPGELVGLIGRNGAGKSTLLDAVAGVTVPQRGRILLNDRDVTAMPAHRRSRLGIGRTFQSVELMPSLTVRDNVLLGCQARQRTGLLSDGLRLWRSAKAERLGRREAGRILERLALSGHADKAVGDLPLGLRRLVEIARALAGKPKLLLLDEVGSGMEAGDLAQISILLPQLGEELGMGVLLVEHDVDFLFQICDFVYVIEGGRIAVRGTPETIRRHPAVTATYMGAAGDADNTRATAVR